MSKSLLLDFDGVIFNNIRMNRIIQHRATLYLQNYTHMPYYVASKVNAKLYKKYGHTVYLMKDLIEYPENITMNDFNDYVYSSKVLDSISEEIDNDDIYTANQWSDTIQQFKDNDYKVKIFSNAPSKWIERCLNVLPGDMHSIFDDCFCFDNLESLKPTEDSYFEVYENEKKIIFVDDSIDNLKPTQEFENWYPVFFGKNTEDDIFSTTSPIAIQHFI